MALWLLPAWCGAQDATDAGAPGYRTEVVRAPDGSLRRGRLDVPAWVVWIGGVGVAGGAAGALAWRLRRRRR